MKRSIIKKLLTVVLMITYMAGAVGLTFSLHYCGGHFKHLSFSSDTEKGCCGKNEHKSHCCKDKTFKAKFKDNHTSFAKAVVAKVFFADAIIHQPVLSAQAISYADCDIYVANDSSPPFVRGVPIYLMNRVFRI